METCCHRKHLQMKKSTLHCDVALPLKTTAFSRHQSVQSQFKFVVSPTYVENPSLEVFYVSTMLCYISLKHEVIVIT